ncbi:MAG TPA: DNA-deoxyinosine glycosylase [Noviherbaspirillum sp.]|nr:DNA-deoxyinosine glycosylase [Noviherbaspirillum sp.]
MQSQAHSSRKTHKKARRHPLEMDGLRVEVACQTDQNLNQFWRLLSAVLNEDLVALPYEQRLQRLLARRIGLWDVLAACAREGSLDTAIRQAQANDFAVLKHQCPQLRRICFNGKTSGKFESHFADAGFETLVLPSSSPAHASLSFEQKLGIWKNIIL